jgi:two-component system nitrogen regulation sensor histidine kinase NtrY
LLEASKLSDINNIDINLYDPNGWLVQSTRPEIFQQGLISKKIAPLAMDVYASQDANQIVLQEHIGTLDYSSFYIPLSEIEIGKRLGILHIPYFEKSNDINKEVSSFLVTLT